MNRLSWAIVALLAVALAVDSPAPARQALPGAEKLAASTCAQERKATGQRAFTRKYRERDAMRSCARKVRRKVRVAIREANRLCREELAELGSAEFAEVWGTDESGSDAIAECVAYTLDSLLQPESEDGEGAEFV